MTKLTAVLTAGLFAAGTMFAEDSQKCADHVAHCKALVDSFDINVGVKFHIKLMLDSYQQSGCYPGAYDNKIKQHVFPVLANTPEQLAKFKAECGPLE